MSFGGGERESRRESGGGRGRVRDELEVREEAIGPFSGGSCGGGGGETGGFGDVAVVRRKEEAWRGEGDGEVSES